MKLTTSQSIKVQMLRGLAIIAVVFIHNTPSGLAQVFYRPFLNFSVGLFLFLSGMLSSAVNWSPKRRIVKVLIPYILWSSIYTVIYNITKNPINILIIFVKNIITGNASAVMYYIFVYCQFALIIPLVDKLAKSRFKYLGFIITPIEIIVMRLIPLITGLEVNKYISIIMDISCLSWFIYFYLGYLLGNKYVFMNIVPKKIIVFWIISIVIQIIEGGGYYMLGFENCGTQLKLTSVLSGILFALVAYNYVFYGKGKIIPVLKLLGDHSFGIYFSHLAVMQVIRKVPLYSQCVSYPITAIITVILTTLCVLFGKKVLGKYSIFLAL